MKAGVRRIILRAFFRRFLAGETAYLKPAIQRIEQHLWFKRLGNVIIHASFKTALPVALHGMGSHGNNRDMPPAFLFPFANSVVEFEPSISGI